MLCLSTAHLNPATVDAVSESLGDVLGLLPRIAIGGFYDGDVGFVLFVPDPEDVEPKTPPDLVAIYDFARGLGCKNVLLDRDAPTVEGLEVFDW